MCGIFGLIQLDNKFIYTPSTPTGVYLDLKVPDSENVLKTLCVLSTFRGTDSAGLAEIDLDSTEVVVNKLPVNGLQFINTADWNASTQKTRLKNIAWLGHCRWGTVGGNSWKASHPFEFDSIVGVHNGTLSSYKHMYEKAVSDSEAIFYKLNTTQDPIEVLEKLNGSFALSWYDKVSNKVLFTRNKERPLCYLRNDKGLIFSSELQFIHFSTLRALGSDAHKELWKNSEAGEFDTNKLYSYDPSNGSIDEEPYKEWINTPTVYYSRNPIYTGRYENSTGVNKVEEQLPHKKGDLIEIIPLSYTEYQGNNEDKKGTLSGYTQHGSLVYFVEVFGVSDVAQKFHAYFESIFNEELKMFTAIVSNSHSCTSEKTTSNLTCTVSEKKLHFTRDKYKLDSESCILTYTCNPNTLNFTTIEDVVDQEIKNDIIY